MGARDIAVLTISNLSELTFNSLSTSITLSFNGPDQIMRDDMITLIPCSFNLLAEPTILLTTSSGLGARQIVSSYVENDMIRTPGDDGLQVMVHVSTGCTWKTLHLDLLCTGHHPPVETFDHI